MNGLNKKAVTRVLAILFVVIIVGGVAHAVFIDAFNKTERTAVGSDKAQATYLEFNDREDSTSVWVKRDYDLYGQNVDLQAQTVDGTLVNNSDDAIVSWVATINVENDCFINNAWVGTVEIHQFVGTDREATQTLDLRDYDLADVKLEYLYDGDLLIPLAKGDRIVYHPDEKDELAIAPHGELTMGMIFYYLGDLNLSNHSIDFFYHRDFTYGLSFIALALLAIIWVLLFAGTVVADVSYRHAMREWNLRKSGLSSMSSIYSVISFIDLGKDELTPVYADGMTKEVLPQGARAKEKMHDIFLRDTTAPYRTAVLEFIDIDTLPARLEKGNIALEYESKAYGWSRIRFFAVDRQEGQPLKRVLLTIQDINDEKREVEQYEKHSAEVELESNTRGFFIAGVTSGMKPSVQAIDGLAEKIVDETEDASVAGYAEQIRSRGKLLTHLIESALDSSGVAGGFETVLKEYELADIIADACSIVETIIVDKPFAFESDISPSIPERLVGDDRRIERALIGMLAFAGSIEGVTGVRLSVYGTAHEGEEHILFSVKANGSGVSERKAAVFADFVANADESSVHVIDDEAKELEAIALLLVHMGSKLQMVNEPDESVELYFEMEQRIAGDSPSDGDADGA